MAEVPGSDGLGAIEARFNANIGGGYNGVGSRQGDGGDLSDVALNWMLQQAQAQGLQFNELPDELRVASNPIVHDETTAGVFFNPSPAQTAIVKLAMRMEAV